MDEHMLKRAVWDVGTIGLIARKRAIVDEDLTRESYVHSVSNPGITR